MHPAHESFDVGKAEIVEQPFPERLVVGVDQQTVGADCIREFRPIDHGIEKPHHFIIHEHGGIQLLTRVPAPHGPHDRSPEVLGCLEGEFRNAEFDQVRACLGDPERSLTGCCSHSLMLSNVC